MPSALQCSFIHAPGVGPATEAALWRDGIATWRDFALAAPRLPLGPRKTPRVAAAVEESRRALEAADARHFTDAMGSGSAWRVWPDFSEDCCFLDIETTGMFYGGSRITLVGVYDGARARVFIAGRNLDELPEALSRFRLVVTFNGARFDLPFLRSEFGPRLLARSGHVDLRYVLRALGYKGGLKAIERTLGMSRPGEVASFDGWDAVRLWHEHKAGSKEALRLLVEYNLEDVLNLEPLLRLAVNENIRRLGMPADAAPAESDLRAGEIIAGVVKGL